MEYPWIVEAKKHIGLREIPGVKHNSTIIDWLKKLKAYWLEDETPWCAVYVSNCFKVCELSIPTYWMRAKAYAESGVKLDKPISGCVVVFERKGGGHVGFLMGKTSDGFLSVLGGNQGNAVTIAKFDTQRVVGYYWPKEVPVPQDAKLDIVSNAGVVSTNEA
jgi:uncharacterized protein (TIGR02594 family)